MDEYNYGSSNGIFISCCNKYNYISFKKEKADEYIPFGPFIVISAIIAIFVPTSLLLTTLFKIFTLGLYKG